MSADAKKAAGFVGLPPPPCTPPRLRRCASRIRDRDPHLQIGWGRYKAVDDHVRSGMVVGLGTGSTAFFAVERVGQKLKSGELTDVICIPTSEKTREQVTLLHFP